MLEINQLRDIRLHQPLNFSFDADAKIPTFAQPPKFITIFQCFHLLPGRNLVKKNLPELVTKMAKKNPLANFLFFGVEVGALTHGAVHLLEEFNGHRHWIIEQVGVLTGSDKFVELSVGEM